jgi:riboflavin-specific deaminase-like protein
MARRDQRMKNGQAYGLDPGGLCPVPASDSRALLIWQSRSGWARADAAPSDVGSLLDLYLPVCGVAPDSPLAVGHLGQGLDGYIATSSGDSHYVTGPDNILHLHRMRALCDAVIVGAGTVSSDDPRLTTRRATGEHPVRVILDPNRRLAPTYRVFSDDEAPTLLVCDQARLSATPERFGNAELLGIPMRGERFDLGELMAALHSRNLISIFVEGGGQTVSAFLEAGLLDRLQVAVAPLLTGVGRPGLRLAEKRRMNECLRPSRRLFSMGDDVLFDFDLRDDDLKAAKRPETGGLSRIL